MVFITKSIIYESDDKATRIPNSKLRQMTREEKLEILLELLTK